MPTVLGWGQGKRLFFSPFIALCHLLLLFWRVIGQRLRQVQLLLPPVRICHAGVLVILHVLHQRIGFQHKSCHCAGRGLQRMQGLIATVQAAPCLSPTAIHEVWYQAHRVEPMSAARPNVIAISAGPPCVCCTIRHYKPKKTEFKYNTSKCIVFAARSRAKHLLEQGDDLLVGLNRGGAAAGQRGVHALEVGAVLTLELVLERLPLPPREHALYQREVRAKQPQRLRRTHDLERALDGDPCMPPAIVQQCI